MKVHFLDRGSFPSHIQLPPPKGVTNWIEFTQTTTDQCVQHCQNADIVLTNKVILTRETLEQLPQLKLICVTATGINNIDLGACKALNIKVVNAVAYGTHSVAEHVIMLMLNLARSFPQFMMPNTVQSWSDSAFFCDMVAPIQLLKGKTLCIVGKGTLGKGVVQLATAFGMKVIFAERQYARLIRESYTSFEEALRQADFLSLHCPLDKTTHHIINHQTLALLKPSAFVINCGRGPLVNEQDLLQALLSNKIAGAALDVANVEPPAKTDLIWQLAKLPNVIVTPHIAWAADEAMRSLLAQISSKIEHFIDGTLSQDLTDTCA